MINRPKKDGDVISRMASSRTDSGLRALASEVDIARTLDKVRTTPDKLGRRTRPSGGQLGRELPCDRGTA